jgi:putative glutamine amidotransferase
MKKRIVITLDEGETLRKGVPLPTVVTKAAYAASVERAGATPLLAAPTDDRETILDLVDLMDGLVITGGHFDIAPERYGQERRGVRLDAIKPARTDFEWLLLEAALAKPIPILAVCGGMQLLNVVLGGTLVQDIGAEIEGALDHEQPTSPLRPHHAVDLSPGSFLARALGRTRIEVNTTHHQAIEALGRGLEVIGRAPDGVVEAIALAENPAVAGVQWHPELLDDDVSRLLYGRLV